MVEEVAQQPSRNHRTRQTRKTRKQVVLYLHLSEEAVTDSGLGVGRIENTNSLAAVETIRTWCGAPDTDVTVKPVIDLAEHVPVGSSEVPDRMHEQAKLTDHHCVFPWCTRPAKRCDTDHRVPYDAGGPTCPCNLAPLCRRHHRLKTHGGWTLRTTRTRHATCGPQPHGYQYLRDHEGTLDVSRDRPRAPE